jgi:hypothetical protein
VDNNREHEREHERDRSHEINREHLEDLKEMYYLLPLDRVRLRGPGLKLQLPIVVLEVYLLL